MSHLRRGFGAQVKVVLPVHLRTLAGVGDEIAVCVDDEATVRSVLDAVERDYPVLRGTIRDHVTLTRRPFLRFFACGLDLSHERADVVGSSRVDLQACKLEYSIVSPK